MKQKIVMGPIPCFIRPLHSSPLVVLSIPSPSFAYLVSPYPLPKLVGSLARLDVIIKVYNCYDLNQVGPQYLYSLFRSLVSMTTVGTGKNVTPKTTTSFLFCIFTYLCGVLIFATIVGNAADMIVDLRRHREKYHKKVS